MKTVGRILIIVTLTVLAAAGLYALVEANASTTTSGLIPGGEEFQPGGEFPAFDGQRPEGHERGEMGGGWTFGLIKNVGVIAVIVTIIVLPSSLKKKNRIASQQNGGAPNPSN